MCDDVTCEYVHLASMTGMDDITCEYLTFDDQNPDVCKNVVFELIIYCVMIEHSKTYILQAWLGWMI